MFELLFKFPAEEYARGELVFAADWPAWLVAGLGLAAAAGIAFVLARRRQAPPAARLAVGVLQLALVALVLVLLAEPQLRTESLKPGQNALALVLDTSASMAYGEAESRLTAAGRALEAAGAALAPLDVTVIRYGFADAARRLETFAGEVPAGARTAIADALETVLAATRLTSLAGIVLASDGVQSAGDPSGTDLAALAAFGVPVYTITVGRERIPEDLELVEAAVPARALPGSSVPARLVIRHDAPGATRIKVYDGDELLLSEPVELGSDADSTSVTLAIEGLDKGYRELEFSLDPLEAETEFRNNRRAALVSVESRPRRILYFEGEPRWEYKFLRRAISDDEQLDLVTLLRVSPNKFYRQGLETPEQLADGFPTDRAGLFRYDALIIGSLEAAALTREQVGIIGDFVSLRGGGLLLLAGRNGLGNGGWGQSAIADVLPARLPPATENSFFRRQAGVTLTPQGADLVMLDIGAPGTDARGQWASLPAVADYQLTGELKPAARTLVAAATEAGEIPLLVMQPYGRGLAFILATGGTWRWQMSLPVEDQRHERFWRQFLRALAADAPDPVSLTAAPAGDRIDIRAEFRDAAFRAETGLEVQAVATHAGGETRATALAPAAGEPGVYRGRLDGAPAGTWFVEARAARGSETIATARTGLRADAASAEYFSHRANPALMRRLAEATGGSVLAADAGNELARLVAVSGAGITEAEFRPVWDAPALLATFIVLKFAEWLLRRRWRSI